MNGKNGMKRAGGQSNESIKIDRSDASFWSTSVLESIRIIGNVAGNICLVQQLCNIATFMPKTHCTMTKSLSIYGLLRDASYL